MDLSKATWRKATDVNREYAIFELVHDGVVLLDVGLSDSEVLEVAFHEGLANVVSPWDIFLQVLGEGRKIAELNK